MGYTRQQNCWEILVKNVCKKTFFREFILVFLKKKRNKHEFEGAIPLILLYYFIKKKCDKAKFTWKRLFTKGSDIFSQEFLDDFAIRHSL